MGLTRKMLNAMGIDDEKAEIICNANKETLNEIIKERDDLKEKAGKYDEIQKQLDEANKRLETLEKSDADWKSKYETAAESEKSIKKQFDDYKADIAGKELTAKKKNAYKSLLKSAGISENRLDTVLKVSDFNSVELTDDGNIKGADDLTEKIKTEWHDFIGQSGVQGAKVSNPESRNTDPSVDKPLSYAAMRAAQYNAEHYGTKEVK